MHYSSLFLYGSQADGSSQVHEIGDGILSNNGIPSSWQQWKKDSFWRSSIGPDDLELRPKCQLSTSGTSWTASQASAPTISARPHQSSSDRTEARGDEHEQNCLPYFRIPTEITKMNACILCSKGKSWWIIISVCACENGKSAIRWVRGR